MMDFHQKHSHITNLKKEEKPLYEKAMEIFQSYNKNTKLWIEDEAFDTLGRPSTDCCSLHSDRAFQGKTKWNDFFRKNRERIEAGEMQPKQQKANIIEIIFKK